MLSLDGLPSLSDDFTALDFGGISLVCETSAIIYQTSKVTQAIEIINFGFRHGPKAVLGAAARGEDVDPAADYMRTHARLETCDERHEWVNQTLFFGVGARMQQSVKVDLYALR